MSDGQIGTSRTLSDLDVSARYPVLRIVPTPFDALNHLASSLLGKHRHQSHLPDDGPLRRYQIRRQIWQDYCSVTEG